MSEAKTGPLFQVSAQRSGSTLLRAMFTAHPLVCLSRLSTLEKGLAYLDDAGHQNGDLKAFYEEAEQLALANDSPLDLDRQQAFAEQLRDLLDQAVAKTDRPVFCGGLHHNYHRLLGLYPDARFVYLYRDGRDVARSAIALGWHYNFWTAVEPWIEAEERCKKMRAMLPAECWLEVRYEDLILETDKTLRVICEFMGVAFDPVIHEYTKTSTYSAPNPKLIDQWRRKMSDSEVQQAEARIADHLLERGYELSGLERLEFSRQEIHRLETEGKWQLRWGRMKQIGPVNFLVERATRKLGLKSLNRTVRKRIELRRKRKLL